MREVMKKIVLFLLMGVLGQTVSAATYYVNDASTSGDLYTIAAGQAVNSGASASAPKDSLQGIFDTYALQPGDRIYVDTGTYAVASPIRCTSNDAGTSGAPIQILGVPGGSYTQLTGTAGTSYCLALSSNWITVRSLSVTGAATAGIAVLGGSDVTISDCMSYSNAGSGIYAEESIRLGITGCTIRDNGSAGIFLSRSSVPSILSTTLQGNTQNLFFEETPGAQVRNCLFYKGSGATSTHVRLLRSGGVDMRFCTIYEGSTGVAFFESSSCRFRNNIVYASGVGASCIFMDAQSLLTLDCNYNDLYVTNSAATAIKDGVLYTTFAAWQEVSGQDGYSISRDPLFVDAAAGSFYLQSSQGHYGQTGVVGDPASSPCIDAADPTESVLDEPEPHGNRANMGCYGQTLYASKTPTHVARSYYVNDENLTGDVYVTAVGSEDNTGLSPDKPMLTLNAVLARYQLGSGDIVYVDTGAYELEETVTVTASMNGAKGAPLQIVGSSRSTVLTASDDMPYALVLSSAQYVTVRNITCTGAQIGGFHVQGSSDIVLDGCRATANTYGGIHLTDSSATTIQNALVYANASAGIRAESCDGLTVDLSTLYHNGRELLLVSTKNVTLKNSILNASNVGGMCLSFDLESQTGYAGSYNLFYPEDGAILGYWTLDRQTLTQWQAVTSQEATSQQVNPFFVQVPTTGVSSSAVDFHLQSLAASYHEGTWKPDAQHSPGIDAGDPAASATAESEDNGDRINVGAYGNTSQASRSRNANVLHAPYYNTSVPMLFSCANVGTGPASVELSTSQGAHLAFAMQAGASVRVDLRDVGIPAGETGGLTLVASGAGAHIIADAWVLDGVVPRYVPVLPAHASEQGSLFAVDRNTADRYDTVLALYNPTSAEERLTMTFTPVGSTTTPVSHLIDMPAATAVQISLADTLVGIPNGTVGTFSVSGASGTQMAAWTDLAGYPSLPVSVTSGGSAVHVPMAFKTMLHLFALHNGGSASASLALELPTAAVSARPHTVRMEEEDNGIAWLATDTPLTIAAGKGGIGLGSALDAEDNGWGGTLSGTNAKLSGDAYLLMSKTAIFWAPLRNNATGGVTSYYETRPARGVLTYVALSNPSTSTDTSVTMEITDATLRRHSVSIAIAAGEGKIATLRELAGDVAISETGWLRFTATNGVIASTWVYESALGRVLPVPVQAE